MGMGIVKICRPITHLSPKDFINVFNKKKLHLKITDVYWSASQNLLIQTSEDKEVRLWDPTNLKVIHSFPKKQYIQSSCHISSDNNYAISTSNGFQGNGCEITVREPFFMYPLYERIF